MIDDGYIKFNCEWDKNPIIIPESILSELNNYRSLLLAKEMIGKIPNGPGFGNISVRFQNDFVISGSNTGHLKNLACSDLSIVNDLKIENNLILCKGETIASSESMTHGVIFKNTHANAVIHIHHKALWLKLMNKCATTQKEITYGTPQMALEMVRLLPKLNKKLIILGGHEDGIISFGSSLREAYDTIIEEYELL